MLRTAPPSHRGVLALATLMLISMCLGVQVENGSAAAWSAAQPAFPSGINSGRFHAVSCFSTTSCTAVGYGRDPSTGIIGAFGETWNGSSWSHASGIARNPYGPKNGKLNGVSCTAAATCMAVGAYGTSGGFPAAMAQRQSGTTWTTYNVGVPSGASRAELTSVSCVSSTWCMAAGYKTVNSYGVPFSSVYDGITWTQTPAVSQSDAGFKAISCTSTTFCLAVGITGANTFVERWNGGSWSLLPTPPAPSGHQDTILNAVSCSSSTWCVAVGQYKSWGGVWDTYAVYWNGSSWSLDDPFVSTGYDNFLYGLSCRSASECWAVGEGTTPTHYQTYATRFFGTGTYWSPMDVPLVPNAQDAHFRGVSCGATDRCFGVGWSVVNGTDVGLIATAVP